MVAPWPKKRRLLGKKHPRLDGPVKSTGKAKYSFDVNRRDMLHAVIVRCPHAHAVVKAIDTSAAEKLPGFKAFHIINGPAEGTFVKIEKDEFFYQVGNEPKPRSAPLTQYLWVFQNGKRVVVDKLKKDD